MKFQKRLLIFALCSFVSSAFGLIPKPSDLSLELIPRGRLFQLTFADPREIRMAILAAGASRIDAVIGNYFSILSISDPNDPDWKFHFGIEGAGYFSLQQRDRRFPLEATDGLIGIYGEGRSGDFLYQIRYTHISAHLSDGSDGVPIAYSREMVVFRPGYIWNSRLHVYGGVSRIVNSIPEVPPWSMQLGCTYFSNWGLGKFTPFGAFDIKWREDATVNPSGSFQIGIAINNPPEAFHSFRFFYAYYTGADYRGQYFRNALTSHSFGIEMQI